MRRGACFIIRMRLSLRVSLKGVVCLLVAAGCGGQKVDFTGDAGSAGSGGTGGGGTGASGGSSGSAGGSVKSPEIHFFVDERPQDSSDEEVEIDDDKIVEARWGDPVRIVIDGLESNTKVRVDFSTQSWGLFQADSAGVVDLTRDSPEDGTWKKADRDGPFWSAEVASKPVFDIKVSVSDEAGGALVSRDFHRRPVNIGVESEAISEGTRIGTISRPKKDGTKRPAVLAFGGSEGGTSSGELYAYYLSQLGYVSFGVGYFGVGNLPMYLERVPLEVLKDDLEFLASQDDVDPEKIAVLGGSRGGELALLLGAHYPDLVHAVIADVPSGYVWAATSGNPLTAWTLEGMDLPFMPSSGALAEPIKKDGKTYYALTPAFLADIAAAAPGELAAARIPVEQTKGPVFMVGGADDQLWPSCVLADVAWDGLVANGHDKLYKDEKHCYPDGGHFISFPPGSSTLESDGYFNPGFGWILVGGTPEGNAAAQRQGNTAMRGFLEQAFGKI